MVGHRGVDSYEIERGRAVVHGKPMLRRGLPRLLVLCAVLFGLFSMHGAPANAAVGCHGEVAVPTTTPGSTGPMDMGPAATWAEHLGSRATAVLTGPVGELCVSTPARDRLPLAAMGLLAGLGGVPPVVPALGGCRTALCGPKRRGPPLGGRGLLLQVCIART